MGKDYIIGPAGNSSTFYNEGYDSTVQAPEWLAKIGLNAFEYSLGRGVTISSQKAAEIGAEMTKHNIAVSVHAPYFINFGSAEDEKVDKSFGYVLTSLKILKAMNGKRCVMHAAACGKESRADALERTKRNLEALAGRIYDEGYAGMYVCPETMGKYSQIGTVEEILSLCTVDKLFLPCFDFGHINCYTKGGLKTESDYQHIIDLSFKILGEEKTKNMHIHFSKIQYGDKGEIKHLDFSDDFYGPDFLPLAKAIKASKLTPVLICESREIMSDDALKMKEILKSV